MPAASVVPLIAVAALAGAALGWWLLAPWASRNLTGGADAAESAGSEPAGPEPGDAAPAPAAPAPPAAPRWFRPVAALATAAAFAALTWSLGVSWLLPAALAFAGTGIAMSLVDLAEQRLPNRMLGPSLVIVGTLLLVAGVATASWWSLLWALVGGIAMFAFYLIIAVIAPNGMGMGDVKLAFVVGLVVGYLGWALWILGLFLGIFVGGVFAVVALAARRVTLRGHIPFGPAMVVGAVLALCVPSILAG
ncbi:hypothetical protein ARHIZOSPH14_10940 [Agromyces rhizosphaerae]|uniref:Prepilin type IV endopeptidase peptidase domain-containing protein n=1 Tax=Agromyces rhizosphaerae TaxID=88374 RepID=A0A9W6FQP8_9MICO|nr:A24 family peptidase [Agromyces rhizosphaerae]GLI26852.1 hypothetical protein ARHIZOSPH14_10940 [Agromyces rhizosphaerae]